LLKTALGIVGKELGLRIHRGVGGETCFWKSLQAIVFCVDGPSIYIGYSIVTYLIGAMFISLCVAWCYC